MIYKFKYCFLLIIQSFVVLSYSQEPVFSQFYDNPIYLNPALAGQYRYRFSVNLNNQWIKVPGEFNTQSISFDARYEPKKFSDRPSQAKLIFGGYYLNSSEGELSLRNQQYSFLIGTRFRINRNIKVAVPIQGTFGTRRIDLTNAVFRQNLDPVLGNIYSSNFITPHDNFYSYINFNSGFNITHTNSEVSYDRKIDFGFAVHNILSTEPEGFISNRNVSRNKFTVYASMLKKDFFNSDFRCSMFYQSQFALKTIQAAVQLYPSKLSATQNKRNTYIGTGVFFRSQIYNTKITSDPAKFMEAIYFPLFILNSNSKFSMKASFSYGLSTSEILQSNSGGICEVSIQIINNTDNYWDICPGDKGYRKDLGKKKNKIKSKNKRKTKKKSN
tara:strand:+ start:2334 stop:3491 length:1158 start_codon:yes stop_codon:yes gene_type:complete